MAKILTVPGSARQAERRKIRGFSWWPRPGRGKANVQAIMPRPGDLKIWPQLPHPAFSEGQESRAGTTGLWLSSISATSLW